MKSILEKIKSWLSSDDGQKPFYPFRYSENIERFPVHGELGDDDIIQVSHRLESGGYETAYVRLRDVRKYVAESGGKEKK